MDATVTMTGMVGSMMEVKRTEEGIAWVSFRLACTPRTRRQGEWVDDGTIWLSVNCWRNLAENVAASLKKGDPVIVTGRLRLDRWLTGEGLAKEDKVIEATAVGPDLSWGRATFRRLRTRRPTAAAGGAAVPRVGAEYEAVAPGEPEATAVDQPETATSAADADQ